MVRVEALHPSAMPDDIVAQLQVIVVARRLIAEKQIRRSFSVPILDSINQDYTDVCLRRKYYGNDKYSVLIQAFLNYFNYMMRTVKVYKTCD